MVVDWAAYDVKDAVTRELVYGVVPWEWVSCYDESRVARGRWRVGLNVDRGREGGAEAQ